MGALFIFISISLVIISAVLFLNKGERAQETKSILKDIYENFKELFSNLKKLFLIIKEVVQSLLNKNESQSVADNSSSDSPESISSLANEPVITNELETPLEDSTPEANETQIDTVTEKTEVSSTNEFETPLEDSINEKSTDKKND